MKSLEEEKSKRNKDIAASRSAMERLLARRRPRTEKHWTPMRSFFERDTE